MGKYFSDVVDKAIEDLYYCCDNDKAKAAADALLLAAKEGDGDACYFLSRCFSGSCYSWKYHPFEENEAAAYANHLAYKEENHKEALPWALKAAEAGHLWGWHIVGDIYWDGKAVERNLSYALQCYEKTASYGNDSYACRQLGRLYFHGWGTAVDYARAVQWLEKDEEPEYVQYDLLGICYLLGYGCQQNPARGKALLEKSKKSCYKSYGLGMMYAEGIGVQENIEKGVEYLKAAGNYGPAIEALKHYRKSLFGVWRRR